MALRTRDFTTAEAKTKIFLGVEMIQLLKAWECLHESVLQQLQVRTDDLQALVLNAGSHALDRLLALLLSYRLR